MEVSSGQSGDCQSVSQVPGKGWGWVGPDPWVRVSRGRGGGLGQGDVESQGFYVDPVQWGRVVGRLPGRRTFAPSVGHLVQGVRGRRRSRSVNESGGRVLWENREQVVVVATGLRSSVETEVCRRETRPVT